MTRPGHVERPREADGHLSGACPRTGDDVQGDAVRGHDRGSSRALALATLGLTAVVLVVVPFRTAELGPTTSFVPAVLALVAAADLFSGYLLVRDFTGCGDRRLLGMAGAYAWSLVVMAGYAGAFPGVVAPEAPLATAPSVAPWLYVLWHTGFPVALSLAWAPLPRRQDAVCPGGQRRREAAVVVGASVLLGALVVATVVRAGTSLPVLIEGVDTSRMTRLTAPVALPLVTLAVVLTARGLRGRSGPERWTVVAVGSCLADLALTYSSHYRYSAGWYCGRTLTVVSATVVLLAMVRASTRLQARLRQALAETAELVRLHEVVLDNLSEGVTVQDRTGVLQANPAARELLGLDETRRASADFTIVHEDGTDWPPEDRPTTVTLLTGEPHRDVLVGLAQEHGAVRWLSVSTASLPGAQEGDRQVVASFADVTEREQQRRALEASRDQALDAVAAKSDFLAGVSHEIRTPLNGVLGLTDLLLATDLTPEQRRLADTARDCGQALLALLNDVLDFSKVEAGELVLEQEPFDLREVLDGALSLVRPSAAAKDLRLGADVGEEVPVVVVGDALRLRQVLANLLSNAVKFTDHGEVQVDVRALSRDGDVVRLLLTVSDTGCGVPEGALEHLFEPYRQATASTARRHGGTGLGLAIVRELTAAMGGQVRAERRPSGGSRFSVEVALRTVAPDVPRPGGPPAALAPLRGRVLVAEDNPVNALVAEMLLTAWGLEVVCVTDGRRAVEAVEAGRFDVVLMDAQMPEMDGVEATEELRRRHGSDGPAVLALSASARDEDRATFAAAGAVRYLTKPLVQSEVHAALADVLAPLQAAT